MRITLKKKTGERVNSRLTKKARIRKKVSGSSERPRLCVFRSGKHMYAQVINDMDGKTLVSASSLKLKSEGSGKEVAVLVGKEIAKQSLIKGIKEVVFDRNGFLYHGKVKSLADGAREGGLNF